MNGHDSSVPRIIDRDWFRLSHPSHSVLDDFVVSKHHQPLSIMFMVLTSLLQLLIRHIQENVDGWIVITNTKAVQRMAKKTKT